MDDVNNNCFIAMKIGNFICIIQLHSFSFSCSKKEIEQSKEEALQWSLQRGSRSGRVAYQFARDWAGKHAKKK